MNLAAKVKIAGMLYAALGWRGIKAFASDRLGIRTLEDLRQQVHVLAPYAGSAMVLWGIADADHAKLIIGAVLNVLSPALAFANTQDGFRRWVYGLLPAVQALIVGYGWATDSALTPIMAGIVAVLGGTLAAKNTRTSNDPAGLDQRGVLT